MTYDELIKHFNLAYGVGNVWPETYEVDAETYASCCQHVFNFLFDNTNVKIKIGNYDVCPILLGPNSGLIFNNVELILKK